MTVIRKGNDPLTLVNVFQVKRENQQELVAVLVDATEPAMRNEEASPHMQKVA